MALTGVMEQVLGGKKIADSPLGAHEQVQSGLSKKDANEFFNHEPPVRGLFTYRRLRQAVIPDSTWKKAHDTLSPELSEKVARIVRLMGMALDALEDEA